MVTSDIERWCTVRLMYKPMVTSDTEGIEYCQTYVTYGDLKHRRKGVQSDLCINLW